MQLTRFTDYALRVMLFVGMRGDCVSTMREIALYHDISQEHLRKVVHKLAKHGYIKATRGRNGGIVLGRDPKDIRIGDIILSMEEDLSIVDCHALKCILMPGCSLKAALIRGSQAFIDALNEETLADLLNNRQMKRQFKGIDIENLNRPSGSA